MEPTMMAKITRSVAFVILIGVAARAVFAVTDGENSQSRNQCTTVFVFGASTLAGTNV
jgi:hypothetical protein